MTFNISRHAYVEIVWSLRRVIVSGFANTELFIEIKRFHHLWRGSEFWGRQGDS